MEAQQIRLNINKLTEGIHDEDFLKACYEAVEAISKAYRRVEGQPNGTAPAKGAADNAPIGKPSEASEADLGLGEKAQPHDLSLVLLANEVLKGSEPAPPEASVAFRRALLKSASKKPILSNSQ